MNNDEIPKYKKRKNNSSKSSKRSDHKHDYQLVIMGGFIGWAWVDRCRICGRVKAKPFSSHKEFMKPEFRNLPYHCSDSFYSYEELKELYPDVEIVLETPWEQLL